MKAAVARLVALLVVGSLGEAAIEATYREPPSSAARWTLWLGTALALAFSSGEPVR